MIHFGPGAFAAAFAAGIVSFVSPCVLPLIPGYLSFVSGVGFDQLGARPRRVVGQTTWFVFALGAGVAFAIGWTPCIGPPLAAILTLAAAEGHAEQGAVLLLVYALGLGVPFLGFGLGFTRALVLARALRRRWRIVSIASGTLLVAFGALLATGELIRLTAVLWRFTG